MIDLRIKEKLGNMAVIVDEAAALTELIAIDRIIVFSMVVNVALGEAAIGVAFGGQDSRGNYHIDPKLNPLSTNRVWSRAADENFDELFSDHGSMRTSFDQKFLERLIEDELIPGAYAQVWKQKFPSIDISMNGEIIFRRGGKTRNKK